MHARGYGQTDVGRTREQNEDAFLVDDGVGLYVVCDGMGGHLAGEVASATAIEVVADVVRSRIEEVRAYLGGKASADDMRTLAREAVDRACFSIFELGSEEAEQAGMGCTLTMLLVLGDKAVSAHVGDSRLYLWRNGKASLLTNDHTMANELHLAGLIGADEVADHPFAHVLTRAVGTQPAVHADVLWLDLAPGDRFLLCSDGLADHLEDDGLLDDAIEARELARIPEELVTFANDAGGHDNVTVVVVEIRPDDPEIEIVDEMSSEVFGKFEALESLFLFEGLGVAVLTRILQTCEIEEYFDGAKVIGGGEPCAELYVLLDGKLAVAGEASPRELLPGAHAGATTLLAPRPARASLMAVDVARVLILRKDAFWELVNERPQLGVTLLGRLGARLTLDLAPDGEPDLV
ncbi:MAG: protein phosphatase 2C domain-containing protein [Deltaproteobacteria bacterium]|nr:protein phosphatase 2C domain-containing protein [Deltaproteobacteria bacterium]